MEIIPAILPHDFTDLENRINQVKGLVPFVQVDICDGRFVPSFSWPYKKHDHNFDEILNEERGLPGWEDIDYEIDLMVSNPEEDIQRWMTAGAARIVIHIESTNNLAKVFEHAGELVDIGLAINLNTPIEALDEALAIGGERVKFIQCMGIGRIGFQGQNFDERVFEKIAEIRTKYPTMLISVDGGVNEDSAPLLIDAGVNRLIVGSAIFESDNIPEAIHTFENI
ncbi:MAG: hypothetical protein RIT04_341 [Candidatus Parcubacteria bacterium]|jgi:ribulose-phosphate 3-epimerase